MNLFNRLAHYLVGSFNRPAFPSPIRAQFIQSGVIIPDISFYQDLDETTEMVNFAKMKANGAKGVIIRAGQGGWNDEDFPAYWRDSKDVLPRGIYWFYDSRYSPTAQAAFIANAVKAGGMPEMEIWCDYEESYGGAYAGWRSFSAFMLEIERLIPWAKLGIYSGYWYWIDHSPNPITEAASFNWFKKYPLWLASYTDAAAVRIPKPWDDLTYWQYTSTGDGAAYGVESKGIDLSAFNGTYGDFLARYSLNAPPPPPDTLPVVTILEVTPQPSGPVTLVGTVRQGDVVTGFEQVYTPPVAPPPTPSPTPTPTPGPVYPPNTYLLPIALWSGTHDGATSPAPGPWTQPLTSSPPKADNRIQLPARWLAYIRRWNTQADYDRIISPDFGPFAANGAYLGLGYPGDNVVHILEVQYIKGEDWGRVETIDTGMAPPTNVTPDTHPWLFHTVRGADSSGKKWFDIGDYIVPILSAPGMAWWVPMKALAKL